MDGETPLSEKVQEPVKQHPDDGHTHEAKDEPAQGPPAPEAGDNPPTQAQQAPPEQPAQQAPQETPGEGPKPDTEKKPQEEQPAPEHPSSPQHPSTEGQAPEKPKIKFDTYNAVLERMETHHPRLWEFDFKLDKDIEFKAGQYVSIYMEGKKPAPFSIASSPVRKRNLGLGIEIVGEVTTALSQMQPGDKVTIKGPFGNFTIPDHQRKVCFLAGGIGITPFMCMLRWIRDTHPDKHAVLFYSCKTEDQLMWRDELEEMQRTNENIKIVLTVTREEPEEWQHRLGRIDEEMIKVEIPDFEEYMFFSCGPPTLIDAMFSLLEGMGVKKDNLKREAWH